MEDHLVMMLMLFQHGEAGEDFEYVQGRRRSTERKWKNNKGRIVPIEGKAPGQGGAKQEVVWEH